MLTFLVQCIVFELGYKQGSISLEEYGISYRKWESLEWQKLGESGSQTFWWIKVWQIYHEINKMSRGLIISWQMKVWQILSIHQIHKTLATPNFHRLRYPYYCIRPDFARKQYVATSQCVGRWKELSYSIINKLLPERYWWKVHI